MIILTTVTFTLPSHYKTHSSPYQTSFLLLLPRVCMCVFFFFLKDKFTFSFAGKKICIYNFFLKSLQSKISRSGVQCRAPADGQTVTWEQEETNSAGAHHWPCSSVGNLSHQPQWLAVVAILLFRGNYEWMMQPCGQSPARLQPWITCWSAVSKHSPGPCVDQFFSSASGRIMDVIQRKAIFFFSYWQAPLFTFNCQPRNPGCQQWWVIDC